MQAMGRSLQIQLVWTVESSYFYVYCTSIPLYFTVPSTVHTILDFRHTVHAVQLNAVNFRSKASCVDVVVKVSNSNENTIYVLCVQS